MNGYELMAQILKAEGVEFMAAFPAQRLIDEASKVAALHPQSLSRFFKQHLGMTFQEYLKKIRLGQAARLLTTTDRTVTDIAFESGFNNLSNFNRHFRAAYGISPKEYRECCNR